MHTGANSAQSWYDETTNMCTRLLKALWCAMGYHAMCSQNLDVRFCYECEGIIEHEGWCSQKKCYCYCHYAGG